MIILKTALIYLIKNNGVGGGIYIKAIKEDKGYKGR